MNININKDQVKELGVNILGQVKKERGTVVALAACILSGLCYWSQKRLFKIVAGK